MSFDKKANGSLDIETAVLKYQETGSAESYDAALASGEKLVNYYAGIYSTGSIDETLKDAAREGFIAALDNYEPSRKILFSEYAIHCIINEIREELRSRNLFKVPEWLKHLQNEVMNATEELSRKKSSLPTLKDIATKVNIKEQGITETMQAGNIPIEDLNLSTIKTLRLETFKLPIEDVITLRKSLDRLINIQRKVLSLISVNLKELSMAIEEEESALTKSQVGYLRAFEESGSGQEEDGNSFKINFPVEYDEGEVLRYFEVLSDEYGLQISEIRCIGRPEIYGVDDLKVPLDIRLEGRYRGLLQLLDHLRNTEKAVRVDRVYTARNEKIPARISISVVVNTYFPHGILNRT